MPTATKRIKLYILEEQEFLREAYKLFFLAQPDIEVVTANGDTPGDSLEHQVSVLKPDVMLLGFKILQPAGVKRLETIRESCPTASIIILSAQYDVKSFKQLKEFFKGTAIGWAYLLKHNIDTMEQLTEVIHSVTEGRIIVDPMVMAELMDNPKPSYAFLRGLEPKELEVLNWMAKGFHNEAISKVIGLEPKTIEKLIKGIYSKLGNAPKSKDIRMLAVVLYLKATGQLIGDDFIEEFGEDLITASADSMADN